MRVNKLYNIYPQFHITKKSTKTLYLSTKTLCFGNIIIGKACL